MDEGAFSMGIKPRGSGEEECKPKLLNDAERIVIILAHYATFVAVIIAIYAFLRNSEIFKSRIWSPFLLLVALTWLEIGPAFEIGNHFYVNDWQLLDSKADPVNASFSFFNFGAQNLMALSLRKKGLKLLRWPQNILQGCCNRDVLLQVVLESVVILFDLLFLVLTFIQPLVYNFLGRDASVTFHSPLGGIAGIFTLFRLWKNLGPNVYTFWGGVLFLFFALLGVFMLTIYRRTCLEPIHLLIGGSFVASVIPLSVALWNAQYDEQEERGSRGGRKRDVEYGYGGVGERTRLL